MIIASDIDQTLVEYFEPFIKFNNEVHGTNLKREDMDTVDISELLGVSKEEAIRRMDEFHQTNYFKNIMPIKGSQEGVDDIKKRGHELVAITARPINIAKYTIECLEKFYPGRLSGVYHSSKNGSRKHQICLDIGIGWIIEDRLDYANECASVGINVLLLDYHWNQSEILCDGITRVKSWEEIKNILKKEDQ